MRKFLMTAAAAAIALPAFTVAGVAQNADAGANANASQAAGAAQAQAPDAKANAGAQAGTPRITLDTVVSSIEDAGATAEKISSMNQIKRVGIVQIDDRAGEQAAGRVDDTVSANQKQVDQLRDAIRGNKQLASKLEAGGLEVDTIVAARTTPNGDLVLFTRT